MNYSQAIDYLYQIPKFQNVGAGAYKPDLERIQKFLTQIQQPQEKFKAIHVAGTNGKGSVASLLASVLQENGYKVGLYTSPHLNSFRERIRIDGREISEEAVTTFVKKNRVSLNKLKLSFFEVTTAMAFQHFAQEKVDFALVEVGLGGRLDATNVILPILSIITTIGLDHQAFLGDTLEAIAQEKAGIIKVETPVVIGEFQEETFEVFKKTAQEKNAPLYQAWDSFEITRTSEGYNISQNQEIYLQEVKMPLVGDYQTKNLKTVFKSIEVLEKQGLSFSKASIKKGLEKVIDNTNLKGRWQIFSPRPLTIIDVAHNEQGLQIVVNQLLREFEVSKIHFVIGFSQDKPAEKMLAFLPKEAKYYFCSANLQRSLAKKDLRKIALSMGFKGSAHSTVKQGLSAAKSKYKDGDVIFVGGSIFVAAEILS